MAEGCRNSVSQFRTIGMDMIEVFKAITQFVKSDFKNLRRSDGFIWRMKGEVYLLQGALEAVAGTDNWDTVFRLKPIFSSSGDMRMPNVGIWLGFEEKEALNLGLKTVLLAGLLGDEPSLREYCMLSILRHT